MSAQSLWLKKSGGVDCLAQQQVYGRDFLTYSVELLVNPSLNSYTLTSFMFSFINVRCTTLKRSVNVMMFWPSTCYFANSNWFICNQRPVFAIHCLVEPYVGCPYPSPCPPMPMGFGLAWVWYYWWCYNFEYMDAIWIAWVGMGRHMSCYGWACVAADGCGQGMSTNLKEMLGSIA